MLRAAVHRLFYCVLTIYIASAFAGTGDRALLAAEPKPARDHGVPITSANRISYKTAYRFGQQKHDLLCWTTTAESGGYFFALDLENRNLFSHPLHHLEAYPIVFGSDGKVYVGSTSGEVMRWIPVTDEWAPLGRPLFTVPGASLNHVRVLCEGRDGWLYAGSCYGERARINLRSGVVEKLPETPEKGNWYVSAIAALPDGRIAFGYGHKARIFVYDPAARKDVGQWMPAGYTDDGFCLNLVAGRSVLYGTHFPSGRRVAFGIATGRFLGQVPWPDDKSGQEWSKWSHSSGHGSLIDFYLLPGSDTIVTYDGSLMHQFDASLSSSLPAIAQAEFNPPPELALALAYEVTTDCAILTYDPLRMSVISRFQPNLPKVARSLQALGVGPDGKIYGGAYQSTLLFLYDPEADSTVVLGDHHPGWSGETFSYAVRKTELICASYTNGAIVAYDPGKPWRCERGEMTNPRFLGFLGQTVYRPFSTAVADDGRVWCVGPTGWGTTGGGIGYVDPDTRDIATTRFNDVPSDVLTLAGHRQFVCSDTLTRWWDSALNKEVARAKTPFGAVSASLIDDVSRSSVLLASKDELLVCDVSVPGQLRVLAQWKNPIPCTRAIVYRGNAIIGGPAGVAAVDLRTGMACQFCSTPLGNRWAFLTREGRVFFTDGAHLVSAEIPEPLIGIDR